MVLWKRCVLLIRAGFCNLTKTVLPKLVSSLIKELEPDRSMELLYKLVWARLSNLTKTVLLKLVALTIEEHESERISDAG